MKLAARYLLALTLFARPSSAHAQAWPRNIKTGKVEFRGQLFWPAGAITDEQQQELVRRWYWTKLVKLPFEHNPAGPSEPTYASLPDRAYFQAKDRRDTALISLVYTVRFAASKRGLTYHLFNFSYRYIGYKSNWQNVALPLEQVLVPQAPLASKEGLRQARQKLTAALLGW